MRQLHAKHGGNGCSPFALLAVEPRECQSDPLECAGRRLMFTNSKGWRYDLQPLLARVVKWQPQRSLKPPSPRTCGFESHLGHSAEGGASAELDEALETLILHRDRGQHPLPPPEFFCQ